MNSLIEIHDSTIVGIASRDGVVTVHFKPAYLHQSEGRPGIDRGIGLVQEAELIFSDSSIDGMVPDLPSDVMDGEIVILGKVHNNEIPIPLNVIGLVELRLQLDPVHAITIKGKSARLKLLGAPKYVEEFPPPSAG